MCKEEVRERSLVEERDVQGSVQQRRIDLGALNISLCVQELGLVISSILKLGWENQYIFSIRSFFLCWATRQKLS